MRLIVTVCILAVFLAACSKNPNQATYPWSYQQKMQSADHWEKLASKVVLEQVRPFFQENVQNKADSILGVYIKDIDKSSFGTAFQTYLATELFDKSIPVAETPDSAFTLEWSVQKVLHNSERKEPGQPFGFLGAAVGIVSTLVATPDGYFKGSKVPHTELLVTVKLRIGNIVYSRKTETLYINDEDTANYWVLPEDNASPTLASVFKGSVICREPKDLDQAYSYGADGVLQLDNVIEDGRCAITTSTHPVTILDDSNSYYIIRSDEKPYYTYVTPRSSLGG